MKNQCRYCLRRLVYVLDTTNPRGTLAIPKDEMSQKYVGIKRQVSKSTEDRARRQHQKVCAKNPDRFARTVGFLEEANRLTS